MRDRSTRLGVFAVLVTALAVNGCGGDDDTPIDGVDAGRADADSTCNQLWVVNNALGDDADAIIRNFGLEISANQIPAGSIAIEVAQIGVSGDFNMVLDFEGFAPGGSGGWAQAQLLHQGGPPGRRVIAGMVTIPQSGVIALIDESNDPQEEIRQTTATEGQMTFERVDDTLTVTTTAGGVTSTQSASMFGFSPFKLALRLGNANENDALAGETRIRFTNFSYNGPAGQVAGDAFACNSLVE